MIIEVADFDSKVDDILANKKKWAVHWGIEYDQISLVVIDGDDTVVYHSRRISRMDDEEFEAFQKTLKRLVFDAETELKRYRGPRYVEGTDISIAKNGDPDQMVLVLAVTHQRFQEWCRSHGLSPNAKHVKYIRDAKDLSGLSSAWIKDLGTTQTRGEELYHLIDSYVKAGIFKEIP